MEHNFHKIPDDPNDKEDNVVHCTSCGKGEVDVLVLGIRTFLTCKLCGVRKTIKNA